MQDVEVGVRQWSNPAWHEPLTARNSQVLEAPKHPGAPLDNARRYSVPGQNHMSSCRSPLISAQSDAGPTIEPSSGPSTACPSVAASSSLHGCSQRGKVAALCVHAATAVHWHATTQALVQSPWRCAASFQHHSAGMLPNAGGTMAGFSCVSDQRPVPCAKHFLHITCLHQCLNRQGLV